MSDVSVGIETTIDDAGTKKLEKDLAVSKAMTDALSKSTVQHGEAVTQATRAITKKSDAEKTATEAVTKSTVEQGEAAGQSEQATKKKTDAESDSVESMRNLQGAAQQLNGALDGNLTSIMKSIQVTPQFAATLQGAFSVIGAAVGGYQLGTTIFKNIVEPMLNADEALNGVASSAGRAQVAISKAISDELLQRMSSLAESSKTVAENYSEQARALDREVEFTRKLLDARLALEQQQIMAQPAGPTRDKALAEFKNRSTIQREDVNLDAVSKRKEILEEAEKEASAQFNQALEELNRFKNEALKKMPELRKNYDAVVDEYIKSSSVSAQLATVVAPKKNPSLVDWMNRVLFSSIPGVGALGGAVKPAVQSDGLVASEAALRAVAVQARGPSESLQKVKELTDRAAAAKINSEAAARDEREARILSDLRKQAAEVERVSAVSNISAAQDVAEKKARAEAEKGALEAEKDRLEKDRRATKDRVELANKRGLPEQVAAQREAAEAQGAANVLSRSPSGANRRTYERELAEAKAAEEKAVQAVDALAARFQRLSDQIEKIEQKLQQNDSGGRDGGAAASSGPVEQAAVGAGGETQRGELEENRRSAERVALREADQAQRAAQRFERTPSATNRRNYERELAEAKAAEQQANQAVAALSKHLQAVNDQLKKVEQQIRNMPVQ
jgi:hypothetical protein